MNSYIETPERTGHQERQTLAMRAAALVTAGCAAIAIGVGYIAEHTANGQELVASVQFGDKMVGLDASEIFVGSLAVIAFGVTVGIASAIRDEISESKQLERKNQNFPDSTA